MPITKTTANVEARGLESEPRGTESRSSTDDYVYYNGVFGKGTAIRYAPLFDGFKEDIVLYENVGNEFKFLLKPNGLKAELVENYIELINPKTRKTAANISPIIVFDSRQGFTLDNDMTLTLRKDGDYEILVVIDDKFLSDPDTVYPVYVDPTITINTGTTDGVKNIQDLMLNSTGAINTLFCSVGHDLTTTPAGVWRILMRFPGVMTALKGIPAYAIINADLYLKMTVPPSISTEIRPHYYTGNSEWVEHYTGHSANSNSYSSALDFSAVSTTSAVSSVMKFNITEAVQKWKTDPTAAGRGLILRNVNELTTHTNRRATFHATEASTAANRPYVTVEYETTVGFHYTVKGNSPNQTVTIETFNDVDDYKNEVVIPSAINGIPVTEIGDYAFAGMDITTVKLPASITRVGEMAFSFCDDLESIWFGSITPPQFGEDVFLDSFVTTLSNGNKPLMYVPVGAIQAYRMQNQLIWFSFTQKNSAGTTSVCSLCNTLICKCTFCEMCGKTGICSTCNAKNGTNNTTSKGNCTSAHKKGDVDGNGYLGVGDAVNLLMYLCYNNI